MLEAIPAPAVTSGRPTATSEPKVMKRTTAAMPTATISEVCETLIRDTADPPNWT